MSDRSPHDSDFAVPKQYEPEKDPELLEANALMNAYMLEQVGYVPCNSVLDIVEQQRKNNALNLVHDLTKVTT